MPISLDGVIYHTLNDVAEHVGRRRETIWRWIAAEKVPQGRRYRDRELLFTDSELDQVYAHAHRLEPIVTGDAEQLKLFNQREETA